MDKRIVTNEVLLEEIVRWLILYFFTQKSRHFDCTFDGVLYSVMVSMGAVFASNLRYAFVDGWDQFFLRLLYSFPWYLLFGVVMGVFYTLWHTKRQANRTENKLIREKKLSKDLLKYPIITLIISSFSSGLDSATIMMSATRVWSSMAFSPSSASRTE